MPVTASLAITIPPASQTANPPLGLNSPGVAGPPTKPASSTGISPASAAIPPPDLTTGAGLTAVAPAAFPIGQTVLTVGVDKKFATLSAAIRASHNGDVILIDSGTYTNDFATVTTRITIQGVGGMVKLVATVPPPNFKGILTVDNDVTIKNVSFSGCAIPDAEGGNGAGIRYEGGRMTLVNDAFIGNQNGILAPPVLPGLTNTITIDHCLFSGNGSGTGYTHNLYVGAVESLTATNSIFENAKVGHEFKSRALASDIENNIFRDGPTGTASYDIDLPNGGAAIVKGNLIEKGPNAQNDAMIHFGGEGIPYAGSSLLLEGNRFVNDKGAAAVGVLNQTAISVTVRGNSFASIAPSQIARGPATETQNTDANGVKLPDSTLVGVLPGHTLVITDAQNHSVGLTGALTAVEGGAGRLTVTATAGHVVVEGGLGGLDFTEIPPSGGNSISTKAGSVNSLHLSGQDLIDSNGTDAIVGGAGNLQGQVSGSATIDDGSGGDQWTVLGTATINGHGGAPVVSVGASGSASISGPLRYLQVLNNGGNARFDIVQGGAEEAMSFSGGAVNVRVYSGTINATTAAGPKGTVMRLGAGIATISSLGADVIYAGAGTDTIIVSGKTEVHAGTGKLSLYGRGDTVGAMFYGNGGDYLIDGDTGNITYYGGAKDSTIEARLSNIRLVGGDGRLNVNGGSRETMIGGAGGLTYTATDHGGANTITTAVGARDTLTLAGADVVNSWGYDTIEGGPGNQVMTIHGDAVVNGSTGASYITLSGTDILNGRGNDIVTVTAGADATISAGKYARVTETNGTVHFSASAGPSLATALVTGGSAVLATAPNGIAVTTARGGSASVTLGAGSASVTSCGADLLRAGSGPDRITVTAANAQIWGGAGLLTINDVNAAAGDGVTVHGGSGTLNYKQGGGALTFIGGSGDAVIDGGYGSLFVTGGAGNLTTSGGGGGFRFVGGSGHAALTMTAGGGDVQFGAGSTTVHLAGWGKATSFDFLAGHGGGTDVITGFRTGTDKLVLNGVRVQSQQTSGGSVNLLLTDGTHVQLVGLTQATHLFG